MPPTANALYANAQKGRTKTEKYSSYRDTCAYWALQNSHQLNILRDWAAQVPRFHAIRVDHIFHFMPHKIVTKDGRPRKNDSWNRPKALHDVLGELLGVDDSYFWSGVLEKSPIAVEGLPESVDLHFSFTDIRKSKRFAEDDQ